MPDPFVFPLGVDAIPEGDITQDLGNPTHRWRNIYVANIYPYPGLPSYNFIDSATIVTVPSYLNELIVQHLTLDGSIILDGRLVAVAVG
jgi:hypothetical protein